MSEEINQAIKILNDGGVVGMPTETVYGLAGSIQSEAGILKIFETKERPFFDPLIVHVSSIEQAKKYTSNWNNIAEVLAENFWPGPLTIVLPKVASLNSMITSSLESVGLRMPMHPISLELIEKLGHPVAAPSANKFKKTSPTTAQHVRNEFDDVFVLDGGPCEVGIESTVLGVQENTVEIYRPGMITREQIQTVLDESGINLEVKIVSSPVAPGQLKYHYMPKKPLILLKGFNEVSLDLLNNNPDITSEILTKPAILELESDPVICARNIYNHLRELSKEHSSIITNITIDKMDSSLWRGILNRLEKAASVKLSK